jgi:hypothetical protein
VQKNKGEKARRVEIILLFIVIFQFSPFYVQLDRCVGCNLSNTRGLLRADDDTKSTGRNCNSDHSQAQSAPNSAK